MPVSIDVEPFTEARLKEFLDLAEAEYGPSAAIDADHIRWKHLSPYAPSTYVRLVADGATVGRALLQPAAVRTSSGVFMTADVTDVLIDRAFRSPASNFVSLTEACARVSAFPSIYHTSSRRTHPFYTRLFRFPSPFVLHTYGWPVRLDRLGRRLGGAAERVLRLLAWPFLRLTQAVMHVMGAVSGLDFSAGLPEEEDLARLVHTCLAASGPMFDRSRAFLQWRFVDAPRCPAAVVRIARNGRFLGYVATRVVEFNGLTCLVVVDFLLDPGLTIRQRLGVRSWLIACAVHAGADTLVVMANRASRAARVLCGLPLVPIPDRFLPHGTPLFVRARDSESGWLEREGTTFMTLADLDIL